MSDTRKNGSVLYLLFFMSIYGPTAVITGKTYDITSLCNKTEVVDGITLYGMAVDNLECSATFLAPYEAGGFLISVRRLDVECDQTLQIHGQLGAEGVPKVSLSCNSTTDASNSFIYINSTFVTVKFTTGKNSSREKGFHIVITAVQVPLKPSEESETSVCNGGFLCDSKNYCISESLKCDAVYNCDDKSDETSELCTINLPLLKSITTEVLGENVIRVSWSTVSSSADELYFKVRYSSKDSDMQSVQTPNTTVVLRDLMPCTTYQILIRVCDRRYCTPEAGSSATTHPSDMKRPKLKDARIKYPPAIVIELDNDPGNGSQCDQDFDRYEIVYCTYDDGKESCKITSASKNATVVEIEGLEVNTTYRFTLFKSAQYGAGTRFGAPVFGVGTTYPVVTVTPRNLTVTAIAPSVAYLSWMPPFPSGFYDHFQVAFIDSQWMNCSTNETTITDLEPWRNYTFYVRGCSEFGCGPFATASIRMPVSAPSEPLKLTAIYKGEEKVEVQWEKPDAPAGPVITYNIYGNCIQLSKSRNIWMSNVNHYVIENMKYPETCTIGVQACNSLKGNSLCSDMVVTRVSMEVATP